MRVRASGRIVGIAVATIVPAVAGAQRAAFTYAPGSYRYALTTVLERTQDQSAGRAPFGFQSTTRQLVTLDLALRGGDTLGVTITVDSIDVASSLAAPMPNLDALRGAKLTGAISTTGHVYAFQAPPGADPQTLALYDAFRHFLVELPARPLAVGTRWADTSTVPVKKEGLDVTTTTISNFAVAGDTTIDGQRAWKIERAATVAASGKGSEAGRELELRNDGTIAATHWVSREGIYLQSASTQRSELTLSMSQQESSAPIVQTIKTTVRRLGTTH